MRTVIGLLVLWGSLMLIFKAHRISDSEIRLEGTPAASRPVMDAQSPGPLLDSCVVALSQKISSRDALEKVAASFGLEVDKGDLQKLDEKPKTFAIQGVPLFQALHRLIDNRAVGYAEQGKTLRLFDQKLESRKNLLNWDAELTLTDAPLAIFPSGDSDLWFSIQLRRNAANLKDPWRTLQVELWKGGEHRNTLTQTLDANDRGQLSISSARENISFQIERKKASRGSRTPGRYRMIFTYQTFE